MRRPVHALAVTTIALVAGLVMPATAHGTVRPAETYNPAVGSGAELVIDNYRVAATSGMQRIVHPGTKSGVLLQGDKGWDRGTTYLYGTVTHDGGSYQMWYTALADGHHSICFATSTDGITWTKPNLGIIDYTEPDGTKDTNTNILLDNVDLTGGVIHDPNASDPNRRYKLMTYHTPAGYYAYFSPDGKHWTQYGTSPVIANGDVANVSADPAHNRFIAMTKQPDGQRAAFYSFSSDFVNWTTPKLSLEADSTDDAESPEGDTQIYGMPAMPYGSAYIGFPWIFPVTVENGGGANQDGHIYPQIAVSRDLASWGRLMRTPVISLGGSNDFDRGMIFTANTVITDSTSVTMYYSGWNGTHHETGRVGKIARATWRRDGFVSLSNRDSGEATMTTKAVTFTGGSLHVNDNVHSGGGLWVEVDTATGQPISGFTHSTTITGNQLDATVSWPGPSLSSLAGQQVTFVFHQTSGDFYSFSVH